jgi:hypothetical protein
LKAIESSGGTLTNHEKTVLAGLEKDLRAVQKAREALGDAAPKFGGGPRTDAGGQRLGKRRRDDRESSSESEEVPEDVKSIPMPRDTPPPIPKEVLDRWYQKRRERMARERGTDANATPLGRDERSASAPKVEAKTVYEAKPVVRDLRKEAAAFVPAAVRLKMEKSKGVGGLVEPEEADRLEREGYMAVRREAEGSGSGEKTGVDRDNTTAHSRVATIEDVEDEDG